MHRLTDPEDQKTINRWLVRVVVLYSLLALVVIAIFAIRVSFLEPQIAAMRRDGSAAVLRLDWLVGGAIAAESAGAAECATRDLELTASIEAHRKAVDVSDDKLTDAFSAAMKARAACEAGRFGEALAIYESVAVPTQSLSE